jgi:acetyl esterase
MSAIEARISRARRQEATIALAGPAQPVARVEDRVIDSHISSIAIRVYWPSAERLLPVLVYFHGGGWVLGNLDIVDRPCRALANAAGCIVVSVDYRLAPEYKFPAALEDAYRAAAYVAEHAQEFDADPGQIAVGGDSAGANLAAAATLMA